MKDEVILSDEEHKALLARMEPDQDVIAATQGCQDNIELDANRKDGKVQDTFMEVNRTLEFHKSLRNHSNQT